MASSEPFDNTLSGRSALRRPGCRHGATTLSMGSPN